jgi:hypothetical protein
MKNWKEKAQEVGIELKGVMTQEGSPVSGQYTFEYKGQKCFTYMSSTGRDFCVGEPPFGSSFVATSFCFFIEKFEQFIPDTEELKAATLELKIKWYLKADFSDIDIEKKLFIYGTERSKF